ncbi:MAG: hypothetical protein H6Q40_418, partial [Deltaproteobacteria bacterium]|nr:hypothetical protein [Deltaproteobacteria bacterium]
EQVVQSFPHCCPYCDQPIAYDQLHLRKGENPVQCPSCQRTFIKVLCDSEEGEENQ